MPCVPFHRHLSVVLGLCLLAVLAAAASASAVFPGRPGLVLFDRGRGECSRHIFAVDSSGRSFRELGAGAEAKFSPDGRRIVYTTPCDAAQTIDIGVMEANGGDPHVVLGGAESLGGPSFSPDGRRLIYVREEESGDRASVWTARVDGSGKRRLRSIDGVTKSPSYTSNGRLVIFQVAHQIETMRPDGSHLRTLTTGAAPSISPGGHLLVYSNKGGIWTIHLDGTHRHRLVRQYSGGQHEQLAGLHVRSVSPTFSPDGRLILFARVGNRGNPEVSSKLWTVRPDGSHLRRFAPGLNESAYLPEWQPLP